MGDWKYGDVLRRAVTKNPPTYAYVMFVGPGVRFFDGDPDRMRFTGIRLTPIDVWPNTRANEVGWVGRSLVRELFELDPDAD